MTIKLVKSVRMEQLGSHWTDFYEIWYMRTIKKSSHKINVVLKSKITDTLHEDLITFMIISLSVLLRIQKIHSLKVSVKNSNKHN